MQLIGIIVGFLLGGFVGIAIMAALAVAGREEIKMKKNDTSFSDKDVRDKVAEEVKI